MRTTTVIITALLLVGCSPAGRVANPLSPSAGIATLYHSTHPIEPGATMGVRSTIPSPRNLAVNVTPGGVAEITWGQMGGGNDDIYDLQLRVLEPGIPFLLVPSATVRGPRYYSPSLTEGRYAVRVKLRAVGADWTSWEEFTVGDAPPPPEPVPAVGIPDALPQLPPQPPVNGLYCYYCH